MAHPAVTVAVTVPATARRRPGPAGFLLALSLALAIAQPAPAKPWHRDWHGGSRGNWHGDRHRGGGIDAGGAAALGLITGLAFGAFAQPQPRYYVPRYTPIYPQRHSYYGYSQSYIAPPPVVYSPPPSVSYYYAPASPLQRAFISQPRDLRISIQYKLMEQGFYDATLDGVWGPSTQQALYDYARTNGQLSMLTNEPDANQLFADILR